MKLLGMPLAFLMLTSFCFAADDPPEVLLWPAVRRAPRASRRVTWSSIKARTEPTIAESTRYTNRP